MRNTVWQDTARIREEGAMNRLMAGQEFGEPLQYETTEAARLANVASRFSNVIGEKYGEGAIREKFGLPPIVPRANVFFPDRTIPEGTKPKADISSPTFGGGGEFGGRGAGGSWGEDIPLPGQVEQPILPQAPTYGIPKKKKPSFLQSFLDNFRRPVRSRG